MVHQLGLINLHWSALLMHLPMIYTSECLRTRAVRRPRRAAVDNLWTPPPTFVDRRSAAGDNLSARRRCHCCCVVMLWQFSMTKKRKKKKGHQKILRIIE